MATNGGTTERTTSRCRGRARNSLTAWSRGWPGVLLTVLLVLLTQGCGVPKGMRVRSGTYPRYEDDQVRFRTTYYFRVFDACEGVGEAEDRPPPARIPYSAARPRARITSGRTLSIAFG